MTVVEECEPEPFLRACYLGTLSIAEAQAKIGEDFRVLELRPAKAVNPKDPDGDLADATEVIFIEK